MANLINYLLETVDQVRRIIQLIINNLLTMFRRILPKIIFKYSY